MEQFANPICHHLRSVALALPETSEGTSCVNRAFKVRKKNFFFLGEKEDNIRFMVKLGDSLEEAAAMADPRIAVGNTGWVTLNFAPDDVPDENMLSGWIVESFRTLGPKTLVKQLDQK